MLISETASSDGRSVLFSFEGDFELTDVAEVERRVSARRRGDRVTLDTRGLRFLDSSALALLLRLQRLAIERGWDVAYVPGEALATRARRTGLDSILNFVDESELDAAPQPASRSETGG